VEDANPFAGPGFSLSRFTYFPKDIVMTKHFLTRIAASVVIASASMAASAGVIDFTSGAWSSANGSSTFTSGNVTLTACLADGSGNLLTCNLGTGYPQLTYSSAYGIGIKSTRIDANPSEVSFLELLKVSFSAPVNVTELQFKKFVIDSITLPFVGTVNTPEVMSVSYNGGGYTQYEANGTDASTPYTASYPVTGANYLYLTGFKAGSEASLFTITTANVPVPATLPLIGLGLAAFGGLCLRRRSV